jgi:hypothetical protein
MTAVRPLFIPVVLGTTRQGRMSLSAARLLAVEVAKREGVETELIDIANLSLPTTDAGERVKDATLSAFLATGAFTPFFNVYFSQHLRVPVEKIGLYFSGAQLFQVVAILLAPIIFQKCGIILGIVYMQIATALSLGCLASVHAASAAGLVYTCYVAFQWMSEPGMYSLLMNQVKPSERSGASAMNALVIASSKAIAAVVAGEALARFGTQLFLRASP